MKKARILVLLCLVAALAIGMAVTASANEEPTLVESIWIDFTEPTDGTPIPQGALPSVTIMCKTPQQGVVQEYPDAIASVVWAWNESGYFQENNQYSPTLTITLNEGYQFGSEVIVVKNNDDMSYYTPNGNTVTAELNFSVRSNVGTVTRIPSLPSADVGKEIALYSYADPEGAYTVAGTWNVYDYATGTMTPATGNFESGKMYQLVLTSTAGSGYYFYDQELLVEGEGRWYHQDESVSTEDKCTYYITVPCGEMEEISNLYINGIPAQITAGQTAGAVTLIPDPNVGSAEVVNLSAQWLDADGNPFTGTFEAGKVYYLSVTFSAKAGNYLNRDIELIDKQAEKWCRVETNGISGTTTIRYSLLPKVEKVEITGVTGAVIGQAPTTEGIKVPEGAHYTLNTELNHWEQLGEYEEWTVFADGKKYILFLYVDVAEGYEFTEDTVLTVNGEEVDTWNIGDTWLYVGMEYSFLDQIDKVDITVPTPEIGQTATLEGIVLPEGIELDEEESYWYEWATFEGEDGNGSYQKRVTGTFLKGHKYHLSLSFYVKPGYEFADDAELYCNGNLADGYNETYGNLWDSGGYLETCYSFRDMINKVEITGVPTPAVGQTATVESITITGVGKYEIYWVEEGAESNEPFTGTFEAGKVYYLQISFDSAEGTEFVDGCVITVNGEKTDNGWVSNEGGDVSLRYSFKTIIDKIEITGLPQFSVGGTASVESLKGPEGANYTVVGMWNDPTGDDGDSFTGTFKADGVYVLYVAAEPKDGYEFAEDLQILIDGKAPETNQMYFDWEYAVIMYYYAPSYEQIGKLELTVKDPVIGETFKSGDIETSEDAKYSLYGEWFVSEDGESWRRVSTGTFEEGKYYALMLYVELRGEDEVWFGNQVQISVNGVDVVWDNDENYASPTYARILRKSGKLCAHSYGDWTSVDGNTHGKTCTKCGEAVTAEHEWQDAKDEKCDVCGYVRSDNPPTGDAFVPACLLALCSVTALVVIKRRRVR